jgi:hypothetical protein
MSEHSLTDLPEDDEDDTIVPYPGGRERAARTRTRIGIIHELRARDLKWKDIAERLGYASYKGVYQLLHRAKGRDK